MKSIKMFRRLVITLAAGCGRRLTSKRFRFCLYVVVLLSFSAFQVSESAASVSCASATLDSSAVLTIPNLQIGQAAGSPLSLWVTMSGSVNGDTIVFTVTGYGINSASAATCAPVTLDSSAVLTIPNLQIGQAAGSPLSLWVTMSGSVNGGAIVFTVTGYGVNSPDVTSGSTGDNVIPVSVNGSLCSNNAYINQPCVSVTICAPGTSSCQTIDNILLDTGSYGLRIFKQALNISLAQVTTGSGSLGECIQYADGSSEWGPVQTASLILGKEPAVEVPVQVIDSTFETPPAACQNAEANPYDAGFNGILGVGFFDQDCGSVCTHNANNGMYYICTASQCSGTAVALSSQVQNPVALLPLDNNGVIVQLPGVPPNGALSIDGSLVLGIGTRSNNVPSAVTTYGADQYGNFSTIFNGGYYQSFIDTGSNGLFFPAPSSDLLPGCSSSNSDWFCPQSTVYLSATTKGASGSPTGVLSFQIGNLNSLLDYSNNNVFANIGGNQPGQFDWGLPFFFGRNVYIGFEGKTSTLGKGPFWAY
jgi:hypothetical protein